jgi:6-phosphogluconolactonase
MRVEVRPSADDAARYAAQFIASELRAALASRKRASLALSGGSSPRQMFHELAACQLDWNNIAVFQVDERVAPADDPARNLAAIADELVRHGGLPRQNLFPMPVENQDLQRACAHYELSLQRAAGQPPTLDVVHLGLGADGHTASLFAKDGALEERARDIALTGVQAGFRRMTLTLPAINRARRIVWFVIGAEKSTVLAALTQGRLAAPAGRVERARAVLITD